MFFKLMTHQYYFTQTTKQVKQQTLYEATLKLPSQQVLTDEWLKQMQLLEESTDTVDKTVCERAWYMFPYACYAARKAKDKTCPIHPFVDKTIGFPVKQEHQTKLISMGSALYKGGAFNQKEFPVKTAADRVLAYIVSLIPPEKKKKGMK